ncbi:zinc finger protein 184 [Cephus cinctus]|uniref:Zinc finger protein 184 n=1 Tax=Cephus cinctus TaxID=211228 RepID=A0AAJ7FF91_CEPCN|nr:zinc finger protein 184 [Cephus cinctus]
MEVENSGETSESLGRTVQSSGEDCRICLKKCSELLELFENEEDIPQKIMAFAAVQVEQGDGLPTTICYPCRRLLDVSFDFKCQVEKSDAKLREFLTCKETVDVDTMSTSFTKSVNAVITEAIADELPHEEIEADTLDDESIHISNIINISESDTRPSVQAIEHLTVQNFTNDRDTIIFEMTDGCNQVESQSDTVEVTNYEDVACTDIDDKEIDYEKRDIAEDSDILTEKVIQNDESGTETEPVKQELSLPEESELSDADDNSGCDVSFEDSTVKPEIKSSALVEKENRKRSLYITSQDTTDDREAKIDADDSDEEEKPLINRTQRQKCPHCIKTFASRLALQRHLTVHKHKTKLRYVCYMCDKQFSNVAKLKSHIGNSHDSSKTEEKSSADDISSKISDSEKSLEKLEKHGNVAMDIQKSDKKNYKFTCKVCAKQFTYQKSFITHARSHPEYKPEMLNGISEQTGTLEESQESRNELSSPKANESDDDDDMPLEGLQCTQCGKLFATKRNLKRHISTHSGLKFNCSTCGKEFSRVDKLKEHEQSKHKEEIFGRSDDDDDDDTDNENKATDGSENRKKEKNNRPHQCALCPKAFAQPQSLANHMERHKRVKDTQKRFLCEVCSKCFAQSGSLVAHMRTHTGVKPYVCNVCSRAFTKSTYLQLHLRTHSGEKPYICQYCSRAFARANTLARHITMHTGEAKYHCQICMKSFRRLTSLNEHTYTHTGQRPYACKICTKRYNNAGSLYAHTKKCKAQQVSGVVPAYTVSVDNTTHPNGAPVPQMLIYSQRKLVEETPAGQVPPTPQFMIANVHNQKPMPTNIIQPFTVDDPSVYTVNAKQFKNPYYTIYPNM